MLLLPYPSSVDHCHGLHSCERTQRKDLISTTCLLDEVFPKLRLLSCTIENALEMCMASFTKARAPCWSEPAATPTPVLLCTNQSRADRHCGKISQKGPALLGLYKCPALLGLLQKQKHVHFRNNQQTSCVHFCETNRSF